MSDTDIDQFGIDPAYRRAIDRQYKVDNYDRVTRQRDLLAVAIVSFVLGVLSEVLRR